MSERYIFEDSSNVRSATWDPLSHDLTIIFHHGKSFPPVKNVSEGTWRRFRAADSPGAFVNKNFRNHGQ